MVFFTFLLLGSLILFAQPCVAEPPVHISPPVTRQALEYDLVRYVLPQGLALQVVIQTPVGTSLSQLNDPVESIIVHDLYLNEERLIHKNTHLYGSITQLEKPIVGRDGILKINFTDLVLENGEHLPIRAHIRTGRTDQTWGGGITLGTKPVLSTQRVWGIGEYNRIVMAGPRRMGQDVTVDAGEHWTVILDKPVELVKPAKDYAEALY